VLADLSLAMCDAQFACRGAKRGESGAGNVRYVVPPAHRNLRTQKVAKISYRAPELLLAASADTRFYAYGPEIDVWGAGVVMAELSTLRSSFVPGWDTQYEVLLHIFRRLGTPSESAAVNLPGYDASTFPRWSVRCPKPLRTVVGANIRSCPLAMDLLQRMLCLDPVARITAAEALRHPFLRDGDGPVPRGLALPGPPTPMAQLAFLVGASGGDACARSCAVFAHGHCAELNERMYQVLMDWLVEVECSFRLSQDVLYLGREILLQFLSQPAARDVTRARLQGYGCAAQYIASSVLDESPPELEDYVHVCAGLYTLKEMRCMVERVAVAVQCRVVVASAWHCARLLLTEHMSALEPTDVSSPMDTGMEISTQCRGNSGEGPTQDLCRRVWRATFFLCTLAAVSGTMIGQSGAQIGCASVLAGALSCSKSEGPTVGRVRNFCTGVLEDIASVALVDRADACAAAEHVLELAASLDRDEIRSTYKAVVFAFEDLGRREGWSAFARKSVLYREFITATGP